MPTIAISFEHPEASHDDRALALVTIVDTTLANAPIEPGGTLRRNIAPGQYDIIVAVTTQAGVAWKVTVETSAGDNRAKGGSGTDDIFFRSVDVGTTEASARAAAMPDDVMIRKITTETIRKEFSRVRMELTIPTGTKWSLHLSSTDDDGSDEVGERDAEG